MYSINLAKITLDEFERILFTAQLLPSQKGILNNLSLNMQKLEIKGFGNLRELQNLLKKKNEYDLISKDIGVNIEFLILLNRMVNSFVVKVVALEKLEVFTGEELMLLSNENIKNTEHFYEVLRISGQIENLSINLHIPINKLEYALHIIDLLRINGVGVEYAKTLYHIGIKSVDDYNKTPSETILKSVQEFNKHNKNHNKATLGISDIDYCRRFGQKLDCDLKDI